METDLNAVIIFCLCWLLLAAAIYDVKKRKIPNPIVLGLLAIALLGNFGISGIDGIIYSLQGSIFGFVALFFAYMMGGMGAGDVKLMGAVGAVFGCTNTLLLLLFVAVCGGGLSISYMICRGRLSKTLIRIWQWFVYLVIRRDASLLRYDKDELIGEGIPFAVAIAAGVFLYIIYIWKKTGMLPVLGSS